MGPHFGRVSGFHGYLSLMVTVTADWCPFLRTVFEVDMLGWTGVQCIGPKLGICDVATEFLGGCG